VNETRKPVPQRNILGAEICSILESGGNQWEKQPELKRNLAIMASAPTTRKSQPLRPHSQS